VVLLADRHYLGTDYTILGDVRLYDHWATSFAGGHGLFRHNGQWQYPPGAAAIFLLGGALPLPYARAFAALMLALDAVVLALLLVRCRTTAGGWIWVLGGLALGPIVLARFDLVPTAFAVAGLTALEVPLLAGLLLGLGGWTKVWPAVLALTAPRPVAAARAILGMALASALAVVALAATGNLDRALAFLGNQRVRGLQIESVAASPFLLADALGGGPPQYRIAYAYGTQQITGPGTRAAVMLCTLATLAVLGWYVVSTVRAWRSDRPASTSRWRALAVILLLMVTSRVLSPQYLIWVLGVAGVVAARERRVAVLAGALLVLASALSQWVFPFHYPQLLLHGLGTTAALALRNALLVVTAGLAVWQAERSPSRPPSAAWHWTASRSRRGEAAPVEPSVSTG